jgi:hypothetical protein
MKFYAKFATILPVLVFYLFFAPKTFAAVLSLSSSGNGVYLLQGADFSDVGALDATITYDASTLSNPRVGQGSLLSGALMVANANSPGVIRIAVASTKSISGTGPVAVINFSLPAGSAGKVLSLSVRLLNGNGVQLPVQTSVSNPSASSAGSESETKDSSDSASETTSNTTSDANTVADTNKSQYNGVGTTTPVAGTDREDVERKAASEEKSVSETGRNSEEPGTESVSKPEEKAESREISSDSDLSGYKSVLQRFSEFRGKKTEKTLTKLFDSVDAQGIRQDPPVVLSDGKSKVKLFIVDQPGRKTAPNFAVTKGNFVSLNKDGNIWVFEIVPDRKTYETALTIISDGNRYEIPLTVAPPVDLGGYLGGNAKQSGFERFLLDRVAGKDRRCDLNGDGNMDYVDDYIFTANFIATVVKKSPVKNNSLKTGIDRTKQSRLE